MSGGMLVSDPASSDAGLFFHPSNAIHRHLLGLEGMSAGEILEILDHAEEFRNRWRSGERISDELEGVAVLTAFFEDSTRTRVSFELAAKRLGAITLSLSGEGSSVSKGESLLDTARTVAAMGVDLIVVRHATAGVAAYLARHLDVGIINAGDGAHEHPTQGLLDLLTLRDAWDGRFEGRKMVIVGDIAHSRVARSAIHGLHALGASVVVTGPASLIPSGIERLGCAVVESFDDALDGADAVMALRIQKERMERGLVPALDEYARVWGIDRARLERAKPQAIVLHPGPLNRGVEIAGDVADGRRSVILDQVENGVAIRSAVLARCATARMNARASEPASTRARYDRAASSRASVRA